MLVGSTASLTTHWDAVAAKDFLFILWRSAPGAGRPCVASRAFGFCAEAEELAHLETYVRLGNRIWGIVFALVLNSRSGAGGTLDASPGCGPGAYACPVAQFFTDAMFRTACGLQFAFFVQSRRGCKPRTVQCDEARRDSISLQGTCSGGSPEEALPGQGSCCPPATGIRRAEEGVAQMAKSGCRTL